jgi:hypothetical protein
MATYKVLQDIEADDKLIWNLSFRQFVYSLISVVFIYISYIFISHKIWYTTTLTAPIAFFFGFLAFPFMKDQPTEVWALAKLRFLFKIQKRIWSQDGAINLVTVTAPKKIEKDRTNGLSQNEVRSRLETLASTLDSRGWAIKNITTSGVPSFGLNNDADRLINIDSLNDQAKESEVHDFEDMLDSSNSSYKKFQDLVDKNTLNKRQRLLDSLDNTNQTENIPPLPLNNVGLDNSDAELVNMRTLRNQPTAIINQNPTNVPVVSPDIINSSIGSQKSVSTISKEVNETLNPVRETSSLDGEVVISLR